MKYRLLLFLAACLVLGCNSENKEKPREVKDSSAVAQKGRNYYRPDKNVFMWEVTNGSSKVWLLGSIHVSKGDIFPLDPRIENAFKEATELVTEVDLNKVDLAFIAQKAMLTDGSTLKDHLPKELYIKIASSFEKNGITEETYDRLKPGFAVLNMLGLELKAAGFNTDHGIDVYFNGKTKSEKKEIHELESLEFQIGLFTDGLNKYLETFLDYSLDDIKNLSRQMDSLFMFWTVGDTAGVGKLVMEPMGNNKKYRQINKILIDDRNVKMTEKIEGYLASGRKYFVVVGAAHLIGEKGILNRLQKTGKYQIKQL